MMSENTFLWSCVWQSTVCITAGLVVSFALKRWPARAHRVLLLAIIAAVLVPILSTLVRHYELGVFVVEPAVAEPDVKEWVTPNEYQTPTAVRVAEDFELAASAFEEYSAPTPVVRSQGLKIPWGRVVLWGWISASLILALRLFVTFIMGIRLLGRALPLGCEKIQEAARLARAKLRVSSNMEIYSSESVYSPVIWCWWRRPVLLVPSATSHVGDGLDWVSLLCHELAHWRRWDHITGLLAEVAACVFPWNPLLWWAKRRLVRLSEQACDDWVVGSGQPGTDYAESLLDLAPQRQMAFAPAVVGSNKGLSGRVRRILQDKCGNPRTGVWWALAAGMVATFLAVGIAFAQTRPWDSLRRTPSTNRQFTEDPATGGTRTLHFPKDRSLGKLRIQDASIERRIEGFHYWIDNANWYQQAELVGEAQGTVKVPAGKRVGLFVNEHALRDLSPLSQLGPNDLYMLSIYGSYTGGPKPDDECMKHVGRLSGLKVLEIGNAKITNRAVRFLGSLESLERLTLSGGVGDKGLAYIAGLPSLKALYIRETRITDRGLAHLVESGSLEELALQDNKHIGNRGLAHLAKLPKLSYLMLAGEKFSDGGISHLRDIRSLRILNLGHLKQLSDAALANLAGHEGLENLALYWNQKITDTGARHLARIRSLKKLDISSSQITDRGLADLAKIRSLEYLDLPTGVVHRREGPLFTITNEGLANLTRLGNLKHLKVGCGSGGSAISDAGLKHISGLKSIEDLSIGGRGITSQGTAHLSNLTSLRSLMLFGCPQLGNEAFAALGELKSLQKLYLAYTNMTVSGLKQLNCLTDLTNLDVQQIEKHEGGVLDISGLSNLEKLSITLKGEAFFGDDDLVCLRNLRRLEWLQISARRFTDSGIVHLAGLTNMERLGIGGPGMTDKGLRHLSNMKNLNHLAITDGDITDAGLRHLERFQSLAYLNVTCRNDISPGAIDRLRTQLPGLALVTFNKNREVKKLPRVGQKAPDFRLTTFKGKQLTLADFKGKVILLDFWATWCRPCVASTPALKKFYRYLRRHGDFEMISISMDDAEALARMHVNKYNLTWPQVCVGLRSKVAADYGVTGAPMYFVIGPDGKVIARDLRAQDIKRTVKKALVQTRPARTEVEEADDSGTSGPRDSLRRTRIVHFPKGRSIGNLYVVEGKCSDPTDSWIPPLFGFDCKLLAQAKGDVRVPANKMLRLDEREIDGGFSGLKPDDI